MIGKIYMVNYKMGWIGILTENDSFSIAEVLEMTLPSLGEIVIGDLESLGEEIIINQSSQEEINVFIQDIYASQKQAMRQLNIFNNNRNDWEMII
ncbi:hypothetical protein [Heyndrickxia oleronia]|uniref:hypothetical protein n=1 Tax=Heyndrickxia oleronia TaxID=38875 RepID=UPI001C0EDEDD|nr:hypothetical protein [Heyndrickxia oleronia]MBU5214941.1 hypothetical protein [Heyndrickxia oleronia]